MNENFECKTYNNNEEDTIKNCSNVEIESIIQKSLGSGTYGIIFPVLVKFGSEKTTLILKKISMVTETIKQEDDFIEDMYDEVDYSYEMGKHNIGPRVYDAFFYRLDHTINQYILMEKFDTSVANWLLSNNNSLNFSNCQFVTNEMLELLHKQIFVLDIYCGDIKTDNFVINFNPLVVRMIDFGIDWCTKTTLPKAYSIVKSIKHLLSIEKKEIFYCMCIIQLFINIINIGTPLHVTKMILRPFYMDDIFIKHVLIDINKLHFEKPDMTKVRRIKRRSKKMNEKINFKAMFKDMLDYGRDQAILLSHYAKQNKTQTNSQIVDYVFSKIEEISTIFKN